MHEAPPEISGAAIVAAATIYATTLQQNTGKTAPSDDEAIERVAEIARKILTKFTG